MAPGRAEKYVSPKGSAWYAKTLSLRSTAICLEASAGVLGLRAWRTGGAHVLLLRHGKSVVCRAPRGPLALKTIDLLFFHESTVKNSW